MRLSHCVRPFLLLLRKFSLCFASLSVLVREASICMGVYGREGGALGSGCRDVLGGRHPSLTRPPADAEPLLRHRVLSCRCGPTVGFPGSVADAHLETSQNDRDSVPPRASVPH